MKKLFVIIVIFAGFEPLAFCTTPKNERIIYLADFLDRADSMDAVPALRAALEQCIATDAAKLVLPGGTLRMRPDRAVEKYLFISNNDESLKRIAFDLTGMHNFTIDGNGTKLLFTGFISPFYLEEAQNIVIENLSVDYTRTFNSEGTIVAKGNGWLDLSFPDEYRIDIQNGLLRFRDTEGIIYPYGSLLEFNVKRREPAFHANDIWLWNGGIAVEQISKKTYRIKHKDITGTIGNIMVFGAAARLNPCFTLYRTEGVILRNINIYHCGGMGVIAQCSRNIELNKIKVTPAPGKNRMVSITADATHFVNCGGYVRMINCLFENQKDDATNIHGLYMPVARVEGCDKLLLCWQNSGQYGIDFLNVGMRVELVDNDTLGAYAHRVVKHVKRLNKRYTEVTFTEPLPERVQEKHLVAADNQYPDVLIKGCIIQNNRARGLLLGSRGRMVIEGNYFHTAGAAILFEGDGNYWFEQSGVRNVVIRNNVFENGNYGCLDWGNACIAVGSGIPNKEASRYHRNIQVEKNRFQVFDPRIVNLYCVDGFTFTADNEIKMTEDYPYTLNEARHFIFANCDNVNIENN